MDDRITLVPETYPELEREIYDSLVEPTERETLIDLLPFTIEDSQ